MKISFGRKYMNGMRIFYLLLSVAVAPLLATAQVDYRPLLCEGRVWNEYANTECYHPLVIEGKQWHEQSGTEIVDYDYYYAISGDTVIGGESYKKLFQTLIITPKDVKGQQGGTEPVTYGPGVMAFLQEHDGKVYRLDKYGHKGVLYDFSLNAGDVAFEDDNYVQIVTKVDTILVSGRKLRRLWLTETEKRYGNTYQGYWVEGIGCNHGLEQPNQWPWPKSARMRECQEDGNVIFTASDFESPGLVAGKCATPAIAYDNGRLLFSCETTGAECAYEIKCTDAVSGRGGEVSLSQTYEIRVHATLDGYEDSDVAVATIGWRNGRPVLEGFSSVTMDGADGNADVNGDGKVDVADIATVIDEMAR